MRRVLIETIKICILGILILISLIILEMIYEPVSVKANRVLGQGTYIGQEFTKEEMDEYMADLFKIRAQDMSPESIFKWELP